MKLSFKIRILFFFVGLLSLSLGLILVLTLRWISIRVDDDIRFRLKQTTESLCRLHTNEMAVRARRFQSLALEPRFRALAEVGDKPTLKFAAGEIRGELHSHAFAFLGPSGEILAWDGSGERDLAGRIGAVIVDEPVFTETFFVEGQALEVTFVRMTAGAETKGYILVALLIDSSILDDYSDTIGSPVEIHVHNRVIAASRSRVAADSAIKSSSFLLREPIRMVVNLDSSAIASPFYDTVNTIFVISAMVIIAGGTIAFWIAGNFSRPIRHLADYTQKVGEGDFSVRAIETGAPELRALARNFNWMTSSISKYQNELRDTAGNLQIEVKEKTRQAELLNQEINEHKKTMKRLNTALVAAEQANQAKSDFLANISHELRTPLHGILSFAGFGIRKHKTARIDKLLNYFTSIDASGRILLALVNNLLDLAKLESGKVTFNFVRTDLNTLIAGILDEFNQETLQKKIVVERDSGDAVCEVVLDADKIKQVVRNLVDNAVKFSPEQRIIKIITNRDCNVITVTVEDDGVGIPEDEIEIVFDRFTQSSKTRTGAGGTGLGLSICKEIIKAHQGRIWAGNRLGAGAVVAFELPVDPAVL